jgi:hypothetical protein
MTAKIQGKADRAALELEGGVNVFVGVPEIPSISGALSGGLPLVSDGSFCPVPHSGQNLSPLSTGVPQPEQVVVSAISPAPCAVTLLHGEKQYPQEKRSFTKRGCAIAGAGISLWCALVARLSLR